MSEDGYQVKDQGEFEMILIRNHHPAIITAELFEAVQHTKLERPKEVIDGQGMKIIFYRYLRVSI